MQSSGYQLIAELDRLAKDLSVLGMVLAQPKHHSPNTAAVRPKDDCLPVYTRDSELFLGTLAEIQVWMEGVRWARHYDRLLKVSDDTRRTKKEDDYCHRWMLSQLSKDHTPKTK